MGPRPIRRLVVGDTETLEEISCGHQKDKRRKGTNLKKKKDGDLLAQDGDDPPLWNLSFRLKD